MFRNSLISLPGGSPDCIILDSLFFDNFILANKLYTKSLKSLEACILVNNSLSGELLLSLELQITFNEIFKVTSAPYFFLILIFYDVSKETLHLNCYTKSFYFDVILIENKFTIHTHSFVKKNPK